MIAEEGDKLLDQEALTQEALDLAENSGIVFIDEIDKVASRAERAGADISREGVQRDLLPLIEGTTVSTKHGQVKTDHILFIASGAFHVAKPSDLLPELQGRLPIRVELKALTRDDLRRILTEPEANLIRQHQALLATEGVTLIFTDDAIDALADAAEAVNGSLENIGARRLQTVLEKVVEDISFTAADRSGETITIDADYVQRPCRRAGQERGSVAVHTLRQQSMPEGGEITHSPSIGLAMQTLCCRTGTSTKSSGRLSCDVLSRMSVKTACGPFHCADGRPYVARPRHRSWLHYETRQASHERLGANSGTDRCSSDVCS